MLDPKNLKPGKEQHEIFTVDRPVKKIEHVQYDYRAVDGKLFSCVSKSLDAARSKRDRWIAKRE